MVTYGPWTQAEDVAVTTTGYGYADLRQTRGPDNSHPSGGDDAQIVSDAITGERNNGDPLGYVSVGSSDYPFQATTFVNIGPSGAAPYPFVTNVRRDDAGMFLAVAPAVSQARGALGIDLPPGASVEFESDVYVPVRATVTVPMTDAAINGEFGVTVSTPLAVDFYVRPSALGHASPGRFIAQHFTSSSVDQVKYTLQFEAQESDITPDGGFVISPLANYLDSPGWGVTSAPVPRSGWWQVGRNLAVDANAAVITAWVIRPPRYRHVYEATGLPPLRQSPRDDNLGTSSAARIWPSSSQQGSLRRLGYF